jgi:hypothetical protein
LKRATFLVNTKQFVYYRKNGVNDDQVPRKCIPGADYLTDEGKKWYFKFKNNVKDPPQLRHRSSKGTGVAVPHLQEASGAAAA